MGDWNGKVRCTQSSSISFTEGKIYEVTNGYLKDNQGFMYSKRHNIDDLNDSLASQFEEVVTVESVSKPKLCEILGADVDEKFKIDFKFRISDSEYYINDKGNLVQIGNNFDAGANEFVVPLINGNYTIIKLPFYQYSEAEITTLSALWLNGYKYIVRDKDNDLWAYDNIPKQYSGFYDHSEETDYSVSLNDDFFKNVTFGNMLDIEFELSKIN